MNLEISMFQQQDNNIARVDSFFDNVTLLVQLSSDDTAIIGKSNIAKTIKDKQK